MKDLEKCKEKIRKMKPLIIDNLIAKIPIIQGGMGIGVSLSKLAGAVSKEGAIGVISTAQIGFMEDDYNTNPEEANLRAVKSHILKAREIAPKGILGVNIMVATKNYSKYVIAAIEAGIDMIISGAGLPLELPKLAEGTNTKLVPIVSSLKGTKLILKMWKNKNNKIPDAIIIEGPEAGGHLGFKPEQLEDIKHLHHENEVKSIIDYVREFSKEVGKKIPIITAGGISNRKKFKHQLRDLGVDGVQISTKFVTTIECDAHDDFKKAYLNCKKQDIIIVKSPVGMPGRAIKNKFMEKVKLERVPAIKCKNCIIPCKPASTPYCITEALINAVKGNVDEGLVFCGARAYKEKRIKSVKEVISELAF